jgi:5,10-methylenetetrahydromethanopterin reductase
VAGALDRPRVGLRIPPCAPVDEVSAAARRAEDLGFDDVWMPDSQTLWRDAYAALACAALRTERIRLGTAVTNLVTRHPSVVAGAARTVAELAPGRFALGIGVGNSSVEPVGLRASTSAELRAGIAVLREAAPGIPIHIAATGPRNLAIAGELGDGVILLAGASQPLVGAALERIAAAAVGRAHPEVTVSVFCQVTDDVERDARALKPVCAELARRGGAAALAAVGIEVRVPAHIPEVHPDLLHALDWEHAIEVASAWISDADAVRFAQEFCLYGTAGQIASRLDSLRALGVSGVLLQHVGSYTLPYPLMEALGEVLA